MVSVIDASLPRRLPLPSSYMGKIGGAIDRIFKKPLNLRGFIKQNACQIG
jgi:hypothetical protein